MLQQYPQANQEEIIFRLFQKYIRRLTPLETERAQGFPDNWTKGVSETQRYSMMGNAVTVNVIKEILSKIKK
ncbi:MAG: DNA cytosine methyltransferase [Candidatus Cloacimonetes bacterium]|nr:DNA cytosine methyltransferase [Candidatus Cloacimonadota bacterium]MCF8012776.1 DNA cytosine methyltransferase [Candidatus Woesearchaeota archaeon]